jgi:hypothetical protein
MPFSFKSGQSMMERRAGKPAETTIRWERKAYPTGADAGGSSARKYGACIACTALERKDGSYESNCSARSIAAGDIHLISSISKVQKK